MVLYDEALIPLAKNKHIKYFMYHLDIIPSSLSNFDTTRLTIAFFAISGLDILNGLSSISDTRKKEICNWIYGLQVLPSSDGGSEKCGFQGSSTLMYEEAGRRSFISTYACGHLAMTYTGLAALVILGDDLSRVDRHACVQGVKALQHDDGSFCATLSGSENDMRFVYCAACVCYMLNDWSGMDIEKTVSFITKSMSYDYGIGQGPDLESHGGVTYCAVAALTLMGRLHNVFSRKQIEGLKRWAIFRQVTGFQGRPNKPEDTCYSFWVGATLKLLEVFDLVDFKENREYVMSTQSTFSGGFSKWADSYADPMHTYLGLSGLSLMGEEGLQEVHAALNITQRAVAHLKTVQDQWAS
ncbi:geranylgeranyl transferase type-1 subunit beta [Macrosteles quadrilineatus]|uniref:geranylgeranyl transferase type-1 subunit beta n=1 Tax=Macrosteles quadrilineatus TaxID=74068 RepID=UPI0023E17062|nr:geranylgeranyl transferase type-1 subunit beta [Macrosteles quadrilineatus]